MFIFKEIFYNYKMSTWMMYVKGKLETSISNKHRYKNPQ